MSHFAVESIRLGDLPAFAEDDALRARRGELLAISRSRARAWQHNPHAAPDDTVLLVARRQGRAVGYLGLLPGRVRLPGGDERVDWITSSFVAPQWRSSGVGVLLLMRACGLGRSLAIAGLPLGMEPALAKLGFEKAGVVEYDSLDLLRHNGLRRLLLVARSFATELGLRARGFQRAASWSSGLVRRLALPLLRAGLTAPGRVRADTMHAPLDPRFERAADARAPIRFLRDARVIDWMLRHPWTTTNGLEEQPRYHYDDYRDEASFEVLELRDDDRVLGFALLDLSVRHGVRRLRLLDHHLHDPADGRVLPAVALARAARFGADRIVLPASCRVALGSSALARRLFAAFRRHTWVRPARSARRLAASLSNLHLDYCDGDVSFA